MGDFAIVAEGITGQAVLKNVLLGYFKDQEAEPAISPVQPLDDATSEEEWRSYGTWHHVFKYLQAGLHREALQLNRYLIVQIDTDVSHLPGFDVPQHENGAPLALTDIIRRIRTRLETLIGSQDCTTYGSRILFAICVQSMECWLLPLWDSNCADATNSCMFRLNTALTRNNCHAINPSKKTPEPYRAASKEYRKRKVLLQEGRKNPSLEMFLQELSNRDIVLAPAE